MAESGHHDLAVIVAQTACEVLIADVFRVLLASSQISEDLRSWLLARIGNAYALREDSTRDLWNRLTGTEVQKQGFWTEYREHVKRRNAIVHRGEVIGATDARRSLRVAAEFFDYVGPLLGT